ncbi:YheC/YheD family protein [Thermoflavimicrobium dichotomicum]|uniref:YheC/D like ATP-grasp n=1 Tax=Thermoflavimicrobium dichotomicum TaxID=46223 RepID=A0A1I3JI92_9BACL|nr:YheC/YheD family protein [Thermoflavimicrobium dichotomicum]SFI59894.1 YheC/D like ATP-grasp [Thermoflavimicrobium dichotomicum]
MSIINKIENTRHLLTNQHIAPHIPETKRLSEQNLRNMLKKFSTVYLKPDNSCQGKGIMRIDRQPNGTYLLRIQSQPWKWIYKHPFPLWKKVLQLKMKRPYIIQQGIDSFTSAGNVFDIRTHLLRIDGEWVVGGIIGRIAAKDHIVTNAYSGGKSKKIIPLLMEELGMDTDEAHHTINQLIQLSNESVNVISQVHPKWYEYGLDIGIDSKRHLWIYEINIKPGLLVFKDDPETHQKIMKLREQAS